MISIMSADFLNLFGEGSRRDASPGDTFFRTHEPVTHVYLVVSGQVDLVRHTRSGQKMILVRASAGQILAEASVYSSTYHCDAVAVGHASVAALDKSQFHAQLTARPEILHDWAAVLAHATQSARLRSEIRAQRRVADRLDAWLDINRVLPQEGLQDVAAEIGVTREALYRELSRRRRANTGAGKQSP